MQPGENALQLIWSALRGRRKPLTTLLKTTTSDCRICVSQRWTFLPRCMDMQTRSSDENSVCLVVLSVRLSVKRVHCDKTEERSLQIFIHTKDHLA